MTRSRPEHKNAAPGCGRGSRGCCAPGRQPGGNVLVRTSGRPARQRACRWPATGARTWVRRSSAAARQRGSAGRGAVRERARRGGGDDRRRGGQRRRGRWALASACSREQRAHPIVQLGDLRGERGVFCRHESIELGGRRRRESLELHAQLAVLAPQLSDGGLAATRSHRALAVDPRRRRRARPAVPAAPRGREVDASEQRRERGAVDLDLRHLAGDRRQLAAAVLEPLRQQAPTRAVEPQRLRQPAPPVQEQVYVPVDGVEPQPPDRAGQRVERRRACRRARPPRTPGPSAAGSACAQHLDDPPQRRYVDVIPGARPGPRRVRFIRQAFSDRPSMPWARAQAPTRSPVLRAAAKQRRASRSSVIFRRSFIGSSSEPTRLSATCAGVIPASLMAHVMSYTSRTPYSGWRYK